MTWHSLGSGPPPEGIKQFLVPIHQGCQHHNFDADTEVWKVLQSVEQTSIWRFSNEALLTASLVTVLAHLRACTWTLLSSPMVLVSTTVGESQNGVTAGEIVKADANEGTRATAESNAVEKRILVKLSRSQWKNSWCSELQRLPSQHPFILFPTKWRWVKLRKKASHDRGHSYSSLNNNPKRHNIYNLKGKNDWMWSPRDMPSVDFGQSDGLLWPLHAVMTGRWSWTKWCIPTFTPINSRIGPKDIQTCDRNAKGINLETAWDGVTRSMCPRPR